MTDDERAEMRDKVLADVLAIEGLTPDHLLQFRRVADALADGMILLGPGPLFLRIAQGYGLTEKQARSMFTAFVAELKVHGT